MTLYQRALGFLSRRDHSRQELRRKLLRHCTSLQAEEVLSRLESEGLLNDESFGFQRALHLRQRRLWGDRRITQDLRRLGIDARMIPHLLGRVGEEIGESETIRKAVDSWVERSEPPTSAGALKRLYSHCLRLGYPPSLIREHLGAYFDDVDWD